jgi:hypothetical protein
MATSFGAIRLRIDRDHFVPRLHQSFKRIDRKQGRA